LAPAIGLGVLMFRPVSTLVLRYLMTSQGIKELTMELSRWPIVLGLLAYSTWRPI